MKQKGKRIPTESARKAGTQEGERATQPESNQPDGDPRAQALSQPQAMAVQAPAATSTITTGPMVAQAEPQSTATAGQVPTARPATTSTPKPADPVLPARRSQPSAPEIMVSTNPSSQLAVPEGPSTSTGNSTTLVWPWGQNQTQTTSLTHTDSALAAPGVSVIKAVSHDTAVAPISLEVARTGEANQFWGTDKWVLPIISTAALASLGAHLSQITIDKILRNEYIDIFPYTLEN
ncbi:uncharacterized protein [Anolis sagrei]|uniref:uncharacterized protein n=1 Tax=Anolis sagrei TaxID=38937 RepID=UPI0035222EA1